MDSRNYSAGTYHSETHWVVPRLGLYEHVVSSGTGGSDTAAISSAELTNRGITPEMIGVAEMRLGQRRFILGRTAANVTTGPGKLVSPDISVLDIQNASLDNAYATASGSYGGDIGSNTVCLYHATALASVTKDLLAGGYLQVSDATGEGYLYRIKSNSAVSSSGYLVEFVLYDPIAVAFGSTSDFAILGNPFDNLRDATSTDLHPVGVIQATVTAAASGVKQYVWVQVSGPASVLCDATGGAIGDGSIVTLSDGVAGAYQLQDAYTEALVGYSMGVSTDTEQGLVWLQLGV